MSTFIPQKFLPEKHGLDFQKMVGPSNSLLTWHVYVQNQPTLQLLEAVYLLVLGIPPHMAAGDIHMPHHLPWHRRMPNVCFWQLLPRPVGNIRGWLPGGFQYILYFDPYLEKWSNLTNIFEMGWNHQPDERWSRKELISFDFSTGCWELTYPLPRRSHFL